MDVLFPNLLKGLFRASSTNKDQEECLDRYGRTWVRNYVGWSFKSSMYY